MLQIYRKSVFCFDILISLINKTYIQAVSSNKGKFLF